MDWKPSSDPTVLLVKLVYVTCEVERGGGQRHVIVQRVERSAVLQPDDPDRVRRSVGRTSQAEGDVGHHRHVPRLHGEMRNT